MVFDPCIKASAGCRTTRMDRVWRWSEDHVFKLAPERFCHIVQCTVFTYEYWKRELTMFIYDTAYVRRMQGIQTIAGCIIWIYDPINGSNATPWKRIIWNKKKSTRSRTFLRNVGKISTKLPTPQLIGAIITMWHNPPGVTCGLPNPTTTAPYQLHPKP